VIKLRQQLKHINKALGRLIKVIIYVN